MKLIVAVFFVFGLCSIASAGPITEKLRTCLVIDDMTKERLECYDAIVPPTPQLRPPPPKIITDCKFIKEEDERLKCFNRFLAMPQRPSATVGDSFKRRWVSAVPAIVRPAYVRHGRGGCGSRGGAGYRLPNGKCAGRKR
jgi:hypothetical protein